MTSAEVTALLVSDITNVQWLTGFSGSSGFALVTPTDGCFITDSRYTIQAQVEVQELETRWFQSPQTFEEFLAELCQGFGVSDLAFEDSITYGTWKRWSEAAKGFRFVSAADVIRPLRMVKTADEIARIERACGLADACIQHVVRLLQPGVTEREIGIEIEFFFKRQGAVPSFDPIVVSGANSARPHGKPSDKKLERGDFVTLDLGAKLDGYCSDITRTFVIGEASDRHREIYGEVLKAQIASVDALHAGTTGKAVDTIARDILSEKELAQYFGHGLGHGLGRAVHDPGSLSQRSTDDIVVGQVWTVEPGVYIEGFGGVRIEDDVVVTESGPRVLTHYPKELQVVG